MVDLLSWSQPTLFESARAVRLILEVLIDPDDETAVISVEATEFPGRRLIALTSRPPVSFAAVEAAVRESGSEFTRLLREHTGPFPD